MKKQKIEHFEVSINARFTCVKKIEDRTVLGKVVAYQ
jgi:hypothetical protein